MAVKIRLRRMGRKNGPFYRVVATDMRMPSKGGYIENLGWYDPKHTDKNFEIKLDRVDHWVGVGAQMSDTVNSLVKRARATAAQGPSLDKAVKASTEVIEEVAEDAAPEVTDSDES